MNYDVKIITSWLNDAIERVKRIENRLFFDLDRKRVSLLQNILETAVELCKQNTFEEQERLSIQIDNRCKDLINEIEGSPTKLSIEEINPVVEAIQNNVKERLEELYETSMPQLMLRLPNDMESFIPDNNQEITIQIIVENKKGRSPAESVELIVQKDGDLFTGKISDIKLDGPLCGGGQQIVEIPIKVTPNAALGQNHLTFINMLISVMGNVIVIWF